MLCQRGNSLFGIVVLRRYTSKTIIVLGLIALLVNLAELTSAQNSDLSVAEMGTFALCYLLPPGPQTFSVLEVATSFMVGGKTYVIA